MSRLMIYSRTTLAVTILASAAGLAGVAAQADQATIGARAELHAIAVNEAAPREYNACKADAYRYGVMGTYRRLFILSCLDTDTTSEVRPR